MIKDTHKYARYITTNQETRWATTEEIKKSGTRLNLNDTHYETAGLPLMATADEMYVDGKDTHSLIFGSTGSKKTRLFCMPMLNTFAKAGESFIVTDPKGELYDKTAGMVKKQGYKTIVLNFRDIGSGDCWNPLAIPFALYHSGDSNLKDKSISMINDFVKTLVAPQEERTVDSFWPQMTYAYLLACTLFLMECGTKDTVNVSSLSKMCEKNSAIALNKLAFFMDESTTAGLNFQSVFSAAARTKQSIIATSYGAMAAFNTQKNLSAMLSENTINVSNIGREKTAIYLIIPDEKTTIHFLVSIFIKQAYEILISEAQKEKDFKLPVRVNFLLDEFCNMPKIPDMPAMISAARSRNIRYYLIAQSKHQLVGKYGEDADTIKGNCDNWIFLTSKELSLLNEISELCGDIIEPTGNKRRLISVSELQRLDKEKGEALIMHSRQYPFITEMPDIDAYSAFKRIEPPKPKQFSLNEVKILNTERLLDEVKAGIKPIPFPSATADIDMLTLGAENAIERAWI